MHTQPTYPPTQGYQGRIVSATDTHVRVELEAQQRVVNVKRENLDPAAGGVARSVSSYAPSPGMGGGMGGPASTYAIPASPYHGGVIGVVFDMWGCVWGVCGVCFLGMCFLGVCFLGLFGVCVF